MLYDVEASHGVAHRAAPSRAVRRSGQGSGIRAGVRDATREVHERLHGHPGFRAVTRGAISRPGYRMLLERLHGFHVAMEREARWEGWRSASLRDDLDWLGASLPEIEALPVLTGLPDLGTPERRVGALYVVEGSALGGRVLAQALRPLLGEGPAGRSFFLGVGGPPGAWRACQEQMEQLTTSPAARQEIIDAARATFSAFEAWLAGWRPGHG